MDVSSSLFIILVSQGCLHTVRAELQIEDIISSLDDVVQSGLQKIKKHVVQHVFPFTTGTIYDHL